MTNSFDQYFYPLINRTLTADWLDFLMVKFSDKVFWIPLYCIVIWFLVKQYGKKSILILAFLALAVYASDRLSSGLMKPYFKRTRPCNEVSMKPRILDQCNNTYSMPSSHATNHFAIALYLILLQGFRKKANTFFWLTWAAAIGYSRVYCGVHYPTDVVTGAALGIAIGVCCHYFFKQVDKRIKWN